MAKQDIANMSIEDFVAARKAALEPSLNEAQEALTAAQERVDEIQAEIDKLDAVLNPGRTTARKARGSKSGGERAPRGERSAAILELVRKSPNGLGRAAIIDGLNVRGDKAAEASISNALVNAVKSGKLKKGGAGDKLYMMP